MIKYMFRSAKSKRGPCCHENSKRCFLDDHIMNFIEYLNFIAVVIRINKEGNLADKQS